MLTDIEREVKALNAEQRLQIPRAKARPIADAMHDWMRLHRVKDVLTCLPTQRASQVADLLAHRWQPASNIR